RVLREQLSGVRVIRAFTREPVERVRFEAANRALADASLAAGRWQALMLPATTLVINVSSVALVWFGGLRIDAGQMQVGVLIAFLSYFMQILMAVVMATFMLMIFPRASVCAERITEVLAAPPTCRATGTAPPDRRVHRVGEVDTAVADLPALRCDRRRGAGRRGRRPRLRHRTAVAGDRAGAAAGLPVLRHGGRHPALRQG